MGKKNAGITPPPRRCPGVLGLQAMDERLEIRVERFGQREPPRLLDEEVVKVEEPATDIGLDDAASSRPASIDQALQPVSRERFETLLKQTRVGTYSFYRRLPERSREEIFLDYSGGASLEALRGKIVDRYLHP